MDLQRHRVSRLSERGYRMKWWLATRVWVLLVGLGMMANSDWKHLFDDLNVYSRWGHGLAHGHIPSHDPMWQYPPLAAFVFAGIGRLGSEPWMFLILFAVVDVAISVLLAWDAKRRGRWNGFAVWLAAPILIGPIMYGRYDSIPTLTAMAGLLAASVPVMAGAVLAIGGGLKVWPALMAMALPLRDWFRGALGAAAATVLVVGAAIYSFPSVISGFLGNGEARGLQTESVAALPFVWGRILLGDEIPEAFRYGSSEVGVGLADSVAPWLVPLSLIGILGLIVARFTGRLDHAPIVDIAMVAILWLTVTSRVLSPQYNVWLIGMAALVWASGSRRMQIATIPLAVTAITAQALYPFMYMDIIDGAFVGVMIHTIRILSLVASMVLATMALVKRPDLDSQDRSTAAIRYTSA